MVRLLTAMTAAMVAFASPAMAQDDGPMAPGGLAAREWQGVIHDQMQAFRDRDAAVAFSYSADTFRQKFKDADDFFVTILNSGYAPVMESRSETFGPYDQVGPDMVYQDVKFVGDGDQYYDAVYGLEREAGGWRVVTVILAKAPGVGV